MPHWRWKAAAALSRPLTQLPEDSNIIASMLLEARLPYLTALLTSPHLTISGEDLSYLIEDTVLLLGEDALPLLHVLLAVRPTQGLFTQWHLRFGVKEAALKGATKCFKLLVETAIGFGPKLVADAAAARAAQAEQRRAGVRPGTLAAAAAEHGAAAVAAGQAGAAAAAVAGEAVAEDEWELVLPSPSQQKVMAELRKMDALCYALYSAAYCDRPKLVSWVLQQHQDWKPMNLKAAILAAISRGWVLVVRKLLRESDVMWSYNQVYVYLKAAQGHYCERAAEQMLKELMGVTEYADSKWGAKIGDF